MLSGLFKHDGALWKALNLLTDLFALSTLWLLLCIPVITIGSASTALYDSVSHCIRNKEPGPYRRFFSTFRSEFRVTALSELVWGVLIFVGIMSLSFLRENSGKSGLMTALTAAYYIILVIPIGAYCWSFPLLSRFSQTFLSLNLSSLKIAVGYIPRTIVIVIMTLETINLCVNYIFPVFFAPALMMLLWSLFTEPVLSKLGGGLKKENSTVLKNENSTEPEN